MRTPKGFTVTELMVTLALSALFLTTVTGVFINSNKSRASQNLSLDMQQNARSVVELALREIRSLKTITCMENTTTTCSGSDKIAFSSVADTDTRIFSWTSDPNSPKYFVLEFSKAPAGAPNKQDLAKDTSLFSLTPYDLNNNPTTNLSQVRRVDVKITARSATVDPLNQGYKYYPLTETVTIRN
jgi:prepilin-type N-terminal cleavage/methylation domain-containing protein